MKFRGKHARTIVTLAFGALTLISEMSLAVCDQTLSTGANVATAVASAAAGSTVCLNSGDYGTVSLTNIAKSTPVTLQSTSGRTAVISLNITQSSFLILRSMTISGLALSYQATHITVSNNTFTGQFLINMGGNGGNYGNANILIDGNSFDNISVCPECYEGRLQIISDLPSGVTVSNNHFGGPGESDGINNGAYGVVIGPGNVFDGIIQGNYGRHVDAYQGYGQSHTTIKGNYFINGESYIMAPDGGDTELFSDNIFIGDGGARIQLGSHINDVFSHNTVFNISVHIDKRMEVTTKSANAVVKNNIMINSDFNTTDSGGVESCTNCTFDHNLFSTSGNARGTNNLIGLPTFLGGGQPSTWAGYQLSSSSLGSKAATDGQDMGTNYYGSGTLISPSPVPALAAPKNLRITP
ncbi:MAG: right-handed parallel beta-helix repeat-containing protein [Pseudobdellovibrionaceae bacterium]